MTHELKTVQPYFDAVKSGEKTFEIRKNDRCFQKGDTLVLKEWIDSPVLGRYTGRKITVEVTYVFSNGEICPLKDGWVVLGIRLKKVKECTS